MIVVEFEAPAPLLNANQRVHWAVRAQLVKAWRTRAFYAAAATRRKHVGPSMVTIYLPVRDRRRRDPSNWYPTLKACVDGLTDAGFWGDDDESNVTTTEPVLVVGAKTVRIEVTPR